MSETLEFKVLDLDTLLAPISPDSPAGENLRYEDVYDQIKDARDEDDPNLPLGVWQTELKVADWKGVKKLCLDALTGRSKDLQISAWLMESLLFLSDCQGVAESMELILRLCQQYWENAYPELEDDDVEFRCSPFNWINEKLADKLRSIHITQAVDLPNYSFLDFEKINRLEQTAGKKKKKEDIDPEHAKIFNKQAFNKSSINTPDEFFRDLQNSIQYAVAKAKEIEQFLEERLADQAPGLNRFNSVLTDIDSQITLVLKRNQSIRKSEEEGSSAAVESTLGLSLDFISEKGNLQGREEAYLLLSEIADYLISIDPHSPAPHLIRRAVKWGRMNLSELLTELLKDGQNINQVYSLLDMEAPNKA